jgi:hypothetical protein
MPLAEFRVAEFTSINENLNRVCLEGGFADAKTRFVLNTREKFAVGQVLSVEKAQSAPPPQKAAAAPKQAESKPVAKVATEFATGKKKTDFNF